MRVYKYVVSQSICYMSFASTELTPVQCPRPSPGQCQAQGVCSAVLLTQPLHLLAHQPSLKLDAVCVELERIGSALCI